MGLKYIDRHGSESETGGIGEGEREKEREKNRKRRHAHGVHKNMGCDVAMWGRSEVGCMA